MLMKSINRQFTNIYIINYSNIYMQIIMSTICGCLQKNIILIFVIYILHVQQ